MGHRRIRISGELLTEMLTEGWQAGGPDEAYRCVKGLLPGATFVGADVERYVVNRQEEPKYYVNVHKRV